VGYYAASSGNFVQTFGGQPNGPSLRVQETGFWNPCKMVPTGCPETSVRNCDYSLRNNPEERSSQPLRGGSRK